MLHTYRPFCHEKPHNFKTFSFRSEKPADAVLFLALIATKAEASMQTDEKFYFSELFIETDPQCHESIVEFQTNMDLEVMRKMIIDDLDKRVMYQTLRQLPAHQNTMHRNYDL